MRRGGGGKGGGGGGGGKGGGGKGGGGGRGKAVTVLTVGNSVSQTGNFATSRALVAAMQQLYPHREVVFQNMGSHVGEPAHAHMVLSAAPRKYGHVDVALVQYVGLLHKPSGEALVRHLLSLPSRPLVVLVEHCMAVAWKPKMVCDEAATPRCRPVPAGAIFGGAEMFEEMQKLEALARHYDLPVVSGCNAISWMLRPSCDAEPAELHGFQPLLSTLYSPHDTVHHNSRAAALMGCLAADALLSAESLPATAFPATAASAAAASSASSAASAPLTLPPPLMPLDSGYATHWMLSTHTGTLQPRLSRGWALREGGRGGHKKFLYADADGAAVLFRVTPPCSTYRGFKEQGVGAGCGSNGTHWRLLLEFYQHHEHGMGLLQAEAFPVPKAKGGGSAAGIARDVAAAAAAGFPSLGVGNASSSVADACCDAPCVGIPGQGYYKTQVVAPHLPLSRELDYLVLLRLVPRAGAPTPCATLGSQFSVTGLVGQMHCGRLAYC